MKYIPLVGRILFSLIFLTTPKNHFSQMGIDYAASQNVPLPEVLVPLSGVMAFLGAISIILGYKTKIGAGLIIAFLIPVTLMMHNYWNIADPMTYQTQMIMFMKNLSMLGGAFLIFYLGTGPLSLDSNYASKQLNN